MVMGMDMEEKINTRIVDIHTYLPVLIDLINEGHDVSLTITGSSMTPFLCHRRDVIYFRRPDRPLKKGQMVFYQRTNGQYVMHRIKKVCTDGSLDIIGDGQSQIEHGILPEQVFGLIFQVKRKDKMIKPGDFWWFFFEKIWINVIPLRPIFKKIYSLSKLSIY